MNAFHYRLAGFLGLHAAIHPQSFPLLSEPVDNRKTPKNRFETSRPRSPKSLLKRK